MVKNLNTKSSRLLLFASFESLITVRVVVLVAVRKRQFACKLSKKIRLHELSSGGDPVNFKFLNTLQSSRRVEIVFRFFPRYPLPRSKNCENCFCCCCGGSLPVPLMYTLAFLKILLRVGMQQTLTFLILFGVGSSKLCLRVFSSG